MPYCYDAVHNSIIHVEDEDERVIEDGKRLRVPMTMMDSMQRSIASSSATIDDGDVTLVSRQELADWDAAQLSARWKGGLAEGDRVRIGDKDLVVSGHNPTNGKVQLSDTSAHDAETMRRVAYDAYDNDIQSRYLNTYDARAGEACTTAGREKGTWRERADGRLACVVGGKSSKSPDQWAIAGPLSDAEHVKIKDEMYASYDAELAQRWRR